MKSLGSILVGLSAFWAATSGLESRRLAYYCAVTSIHGFLQALLLVYVPITDQSYGFEWYVARLAQLAFAVGYTHEMLERHGMSLRLSIAIMLGLMFGVTAYPEVWFNWLAWAYALGLFVLGTAIIRVRERVCRIVGSYWILTGCWNYAFLRLSSDTESIVWKLNWFLPSTLSVSTCVLLALGA